MGVCIHTSEESSCNWQLVDYDLELEGKPQSAVTIWRILKQWSGVKDALNETVSLVELKPKTGRHHQLRRHMVSDFVAVSFLRYKFYHLIFLTTFILGMGFEMPSSWRQKIRWRRTHQHEIPGRWLLPL